MERIRRCLRKVMYQLPLVGYVSFLLLIWWNGAIKLFIAGLVLLMLCSFCYTFGYSGKPSYLIKKICKELLAAIPVGVVITLTGMAACVGGYVNAIITLFTVFGYATSATIVMIICMWLACLYFCKRSVK